MSRNTPKTHKDLEVWKQSLELTERVYRVTGSFPREELYGLTAQMGRAAVSVSSNIAEGAARGSKKEFVQFLRISLGSLAELETQLVVAGRLGFISDQDIMGKIEEVRRMLLGLLRFLKRPSSHITHHS